MSKPPTFDGPLHLQEHLAPCGAELEKALRGAVSHSLSSVHSVRCACRQSGVLKALVEAQQSEDPLRRKSASDRITTLRNRQPASLPPGSGRQPAQPGTESHAGHTERRLDCRLFAIELNEEAGVIHAFCRRCQKLFVIFDRALYWGVRRASAEQLKVYPYRCTCGGHTFEAGVGFDYPDDAMDENDIHHIALAVRCAACEEISVILDEEAT